MTFDIDPRDRVSAGYFDVLAVRPALGRTFERDEDQPGKETVAVLSHRAWMDLHGGDPGVIGGAIRLDGRSFGPKQGPPRVKNGVGRSDGRRP